ncbi:hypothetical protein GE061_009404 [Apolygus lucorum]|uniref:Uncharacterized protein n=1 Tax=Apolygus lucorum TaxID=248454 RepID=A0A8S9Y275_APOLU|nr:hypothetical protein GE061_009404 [Apolygus lucorum]
MQEIRVGDLFDLEPVDQRLVPVKEVIANSLPEGWRDWRVTDAILNLPQEVIQKGGFRFGIPTVPLLRAFFPGSVQANEELSRSEVLLSGDEEPDGLSVRDPRSKELLKKLGDEVSSLKALPSRVGQLESKLDSIESGIQKLISERSKHTYSSSEDGNSELDESDQGSEGQEMLSWQDTLQPLGRSEDPPLGEKLWVGPTPSVVGPGLSPLTSASSSFLNPSTVEQAPEYALPEEEINSRAIDCQHLGRESWNRVRYAEAAQRLHRGGVFQPLQVNGTFLKQYMPLDNIHKKRERFLATLSYGVLAERQAFNEAQTAFLLAHPEVKEAFEKQFLQGSKFRSVADVILQMIFGGRAEGGVYMISHFSELRVTIYSVLKMQWFYGQHLGQRQTLLPFANQGGGLNVLHLKVTAMSPSAWTPS